MMFAIASNLTVALCCSISFNSSPSVSSVLWGGGGGGGGGLKVHFRLQTKESSKYALISQITQCSCGITVDAFMKIVYLTLQRILSLEIELLKSYISD